MLFIFDWDGTVSDSTEKIIACMHRASVDTSLPVLEDHEVKNIIGLGLPEAFKMLYPDASSDQYIALRNNYAKHFLIADQVPSAFYPKVMDTLNILRDQGHLLAVATGKSRRGLDRVLASLNLGDFFHGSRCADETASKPDPLMLNELLEEFNCSPEGAIMIGDTEYDMEMARNANVASVAVSYGAHHVDRLKPYTPIRCIDSFDQLLDLDVIEIAEGCKTRGKLHG